MTIFSPEEVMGAPLGIVHTKDSVTVRPQSGVCGYTVVERSSVKALS